MLQYQCLKQYTTRWITIDSTSLLISDCQFDASSDSVRRCADGDANANPAASGGHSHASCSADNGISTDGDCARCGNEAGSLAHTRS